MNNQCDNCGDYKPNPKDLRYSAKQCGFFCSYCYLLKTSLSKLEDIEPA